MTKLKIKHSKKLSKDIWERLPYDELSKFLEYQIQFYTNWNPKFFEWIDNELKHNYYLIRNNDFGTLYMSSKEDFLKFILKWESKETKW